MFCLMCFVLCQWKIALDAQQKVADSICSRTIPREKTETAERICLRLKINTENCKDESI